MPDVVTFDPVNLRIVEISNGGNNELDVQEIYSEWKEWQSESDNAKYLPAFRFVGGDPISGTQSLGSTFFLLNGWRFKPAELDHKVTLVGNIFTDPAGDSVFVPTDGAFTVNTETRVSNLVDSSVAKLDLAQLQKAVYIDVDNGVSGTADGVGTPTSPVDNLADAFTIAAANNLRSFSITGTVALDRGVTEWSFTGTISKKSARIDLNGFQVDNCLFDSITVSGDGNSSSIFAVSCELDALVNVTGIFKACGLISLLTPGDNETTTLHQCFSALPGNTQPVIDLSDQLGDSVQLRSYSGGVEIRNVDVASQVASIDLESGHVTIDSTCTDGLVIVRGTGSLVDSSGPGCTVQLEGFVGRYIGQQPIGDTIDQMDGDVAIVDGKVDQIGADVDQLGVDLTALAALEQFEFGSWKIDTVAHQLICFADDNVTVIARFDLFDEQGNPSSSRIFERRRV